MHLVSNLQGASYSILMLGRDQMLLDTRSWMLRQAGYQVLASFSSEELTAAMPADLLILCYTVPIQDTLRMLDQVLKLWPESKSVVLSSSGFNFEPLAKTFNPHEGPVKFLEIVARQLSGADPHRGRSSSESKQTENLRTIRYVG